MLKKFQYKITSLALGLFLPIMVSAQGGEFDEKLKNLNQILDTSVNAVASTQSSGTPDFWGIGLRFAVSLIIVLILLYGLYYFARRVRKMDLPPSAGGKGLQILENYHIGSNQKLILLRLGEDKVLLVGATPDNLRTLAQLEGEDAKNILGNAQNQVVTPAQFSETVNQMLSRFRKEEKKV